jgi:hypothetical protein
MFAITIRGLPEMTHAALRVLAAGRERSLESVAREALAALAAGESIMAHQTTPPGMTEQSAAWPMQAQGPASFDPLWGALKGKVHVAPGTDLTAPTGESWDAEASRL